MKEFDQAVIRTLQSGGVGVIPTDTIYGVVGRAENEDTVGRIYTLRERNNGKACIILISSYEDLRKFNVTLAPGIQNIITSQKLWPGKVSIILPVLDPHLDYLTRGTKSLAFRIPDVPELRSLIAQTGPLIAPSANKEGRPYSRTITMAKDEFGDLADFYVENGVMDGEASTILNLINERLTVIREGAVKITV